MESLAPIWGTDGTMERLGLERGFPIGLPARLVLNCTQHGALTLTLPPSTVSLSVL
jgi:hypothetical protein